MNEETFEGETQEHLDLMRLLLCQQQDDSAATNSPLQNATHSSISDQLHEKKEGQDALQSNDQPVDVLSVPVPQQINLQLQGALSKSDANVNFLKQPPSLDSYGFVCESPMSSSGIDGGDSHMFKMPLEIKPEEEIETDQSAPQPLLRFPNLYAATQEQEISAMLSSMPQSDFESPDIYDNISLLEDSSFEKFQNESLVESEHCYSEVNLPVSFPNALAHVMMITCNHEEYSCVHGTVNFPNAVAPSVQ